MYDIYSNQNPELFYLAIFFFKIFSLFHFSIFFFNSKHRRLRFDYVLESELRNLCFTALVHYLLEEN